MIVEPKPLHRKEACRVPSDATHYRSNYIFKVEDLDKPFYYYYRGSDNPKWLGSNGMTWRAYGQHGTHIPIDIILDAYVREERA